MVNENKFSSLKTIYLEGKSPWGFRIIDLNESNRLRLSSPLLAVSKVRNRSKAHFAGLKEDDIILYVNDVPTSNLTLEAASDLIENSDNLCLVISTRFNDGLDDEQRLDERNSYEMSRDSQSSSEGLLSVSGGRSNVNNNDNKILSANPAFSKFLNTANSINDSNASNDLTGHSSSINTTNNPTNNYYNSSSISSTASSNPNSVKNNYNGSANIQLINSYLNSPHHHRTLNNNNNVTTTTREADSIYSNQIQDSKSTNDLKHIDNYLYNSAAIANSNTYTEQLNYDNDEDYLATRRADKSANHRLRNSHNHHHNNHHHHHQQHYPHHYHHHHHHLPSKINLIRNYYSANESNGEDELDSYYTNKYNYNRNRSHSNSNSNSNSNYNNKYRSSSISNRNNTNANANSITNNNRSDSRLRDNKNNNNNNSSSSSNNGVLQAPSKVSYASITLRQPLKDVNYFSDTEAINAPRFRVKNLSYSSYHRNHHNYNNNNNTNNNLSNSTNCNGSNTMNRVLLTSNSFNHNHNSNNDYNNNPNIINNNHRRSNSQNYNHSILSNNNNNNFYDNHKLSESDYITKTNFPSYDYFNNRNTNNNNNNLEDFLFASKYLNEEMNQNSINNNNQNQNNMFSLSTATDFNRKPHGFSKLSPLNGRPGGASSISPTNIQYAPQSQPQQFMYQQPQQQQQQQQQQSNQRPFVANQSPRLFPGSNVNAAPANYNQANVWTPSSQIQIASATQEEDLEDPIIEKYEREMGSELAPMSTKPHYSDSYFYNSPVFNYPTIDDQKKLAKTIADTLEGSNPATSKYHKKKQNLLRQQAARDGGYESEPLQSPGYEQQQHQHHSSGGDKEPLSPPPAPPLPSLFDDSSLPDVIKRSIAQANRIDPVCMVQAPENFRQQHYTEHVSHTEMPPKAAMSLAAALENAEPNKGGRGAQIFQRRKAKSEKWVVDESNVKKPPGQQYNFQPPPMQKPQPVYQPPPTPQPVQRLEPKVAVESDQYSNKYSDFNAKPRGWSHGQNPPSNAGYESPRLDEMVRPRLQPDQFISKVEFIESPATSAANKTSNLAYNPNKLDLSAWNQQRLAEQQHAASQPANISKDGIQNLKAKFYESVVKSSEPTSLLAFNPHQSSIMIGAPPSSSPPTISKVKLNKLSSHENYLFNNKNSQNALRNTTNQLYNNNPTQSSFFNYDENIAASDL